MFGAATPSKILKENEKVDLKHFNFHEYIKGTIFNVNDNLVVIRSSFNANDSGISTKDPITLNYCVNNEVYVINCEVQFVNSLNPLDLLVKCDKMDKFKNMRKNNRYYVSLVSEMKRSGSDKGSFAVVKNLSLGGAKFNSKEDVNLNDSINLTINLDKNLKFSTRGTTVRKNFIDAETSEYGIEFTDLTESNLRNLHHYINSLEYK